MFEKIKKFFITKKKQPYMKAIVEYFPDGKVVVKTDFNEFFIDELDHNYLSNNNEDYSPNFIDKVKVAFFLSDQFDAIIGIHDKLARRSEDYDGYEDAFIPNLNPNQNEPRQVFDVKDATRVGSVNG